MTKNYLSSRESVGKGFQSKKPLLFFNLESLINFLSRKLTYANHVLMAESWKVVLEKKFFLQLQKLFFKLH